MTGITLTFPHAPFLREIARMAKGSGFGLKISPDGTLTAVNKGKSAIIQVEDACTGAEDLPCDLYFPESDLLGLPGLVGKAPVFLSREEEEEGAPWAWQIQGVKVFTHPWDVAQQIPPLDRIIGEEKETPEKPVCFQPALWVPVAKILSYRKGLQHMTLTYGRNKTIGRQPGLTVVLMQWVTP